LTHPCTKQQGKSADITAEFMGGMRLFLQTFVAISTDDLCNWRQTLVATPKYDDHHHHNKGESNKIILTL
jgi:hypothetical protein